MGNNQKQGVMRLKPMYAIAMIVLGSVFGAVAQLMWKQGVDPLQFFKLIFGGFLYVCAMVLYLVALRSLPLSVAYPIVATTYIWIMLLSVMYLKEAFTVSKLAGTCGIVLSVYLIAR